jgi:phosphate transport system protein
MTDPAGGAGVDLGPVGHHGARQQFDRELGEIKDQVLLMGDQVEQQILAARTSLVERDAEKARAVIIGDRAVNESQRRVMDLISATIATQAPVAGDLRYLLALDHVVYELERMGDHAASVAKQSAKLANLPPLAETVRLPRMAELTAELVAGMIVALVETDEVRAREVAARDDDIDALYHALFDEVLRLMRSDPQNVDPGTRVLFAAHYLERIGDRVTNIAEDVVFLVHGTIEDLNP